MLVEMSEGRAVGEKAEMMVGRRAAYWVEKWDWSERSMVAKKADAKVEMTAATSVDGKALTLVVMKVVQSVARKVEWLVAMMVARRGFSLALSSAVRTVVARVGRKVGLTVLP
jgi:hypothetical protein